MAIPEAQLKTWSRQGATVGSADTYNSIKFALAQHNWPEGMDYDVYLQGSYPNHTNIRGSSDVDVVIESTGVSHSNLSQDEKQRLGIRRGHYGYKDFRNEVVVALISHYGARMVDVTGQKSIKIAASGNRLAADVVPCITYRRYYNWKVAANGITFWTLRSHEQIINYPKLHIANGAAKNSDTKTHYKPAIRMFKNARDKIVENTPALDGNYPSYFVECLLYNVPNRCFGNRFTQTYCDVVNFLLSQRRKDLAGFWCQNGQQQLFGDLSTQWDITQAQEFIIQLRILWEEW